MNEFELISTWFDGHSTERADVHLGVGDDAALISLGENQELVTASACLMAGIETGDTDGPSTVILKPEELASRCYGEALDALLAQQATPAWAVLCLCLAQVNSDWLERFANCLHDCLRDQQIQLIGGDTTRGPTGITLFLSGYRSRSAA